MPGVEPEPERDFYSRRMTEELARAEAAENDGLRHLHFSWAAQYRRRLEALPGSPTPSRPKADARGLGSWTTELG